MSRAQVFDMPHRQPRPGVGRASEHSFALLTRPTPLRASSRIRGTMRSAPVGLSPDDGASFERARPQEPRQSALVEDAESRLSRLLLPTPRRNKSHIMRSLPSVARAAPPRPAGPLRTSHNVLFCSSATPARAEGRFA